MDRLTNLYEELKSKCDPERFMNPYNAQKVDREFNKQVQNYEMFL